RTMASAKVGIVMGSASDLPKLEKAIDVLKGLGIPCEVRVMSAHRTPEDVGAWASGAMGRGMKVILAAPAAPPHLPGAARGPSVRAGERAPARAGAARGPGPAAGGGAEAAGRARRGGRGGSGGRRDRRAARGADPRRRGPGAARRARERPREPGREGA